MNALASKIDSVTVYRDGARITRIASLPTPIPSQVSFPGLPLCLQDGSVRARVVSDHKLGTPRATDVRVSLSVARSAEELPAADDAALEAAVVKVIEDKASVEQLERELERLSHFDLRARAADSNGNNADSVPASPLAARLKLLEHRDSRWRELHAELEAARERLASSRRTVKEHSDRNRRASSARQPRTDELRKCAVVTLVGGSELASSATLFLDYQVRGARWAPAYAARLERDGNSATIDARAIVGQKTGEDWSGVALTLVTAAAQVVTELPVLQSLRIGRRQPPPSTGWRPPPVGTDRLFADFERAFGGAASPSNVVHSAFDDEAADDEITAVGAMAASAPPQMVGMVADQLKPEVARERSAKAKKAPRPARRSVPPPAPGAMPAEMAAPMPVSMSMPMSLSVDKSVLFAGAGGAATNDFRAEEPSELGAIRADEVLLDYSGLVMAAADEPRRGALVREDSTVRYRAELLREKWTVSIDIRSAIARAHQEADAILHVPLPGGHQLPQPADFDYSYFAESRVDIPSDGTYHSIALSSASGPCSLRYLVVPRESCDVFRMAHLNNPLQAPLLPGPIDVYLGGEFLLSSLASFTPPGGPIRFGLGVEQAVRVVRNTSFRDDSAGLLGGSRALHHQLRVEAQNHLDRAIELEVRERVPVVRDGEDEIRVEVSAVSPTWSSFEPDQDEPSWQLKGGYRWIESLAPAAKVELKASYSIRISSKHELVGGNRREA